MKCSISCSFGEIIDKVSILKIKSTKSTDKSALKNIQLELETILEETPLAKDNDSLFQELYKINNKLWILEDLIRNKSHKKEFDDKYIDYAENIHKTNDERYQVKRKINNKYGSVLKEEKIYKKQQHPTPSQNDLQLLEKGKYDYMQGNYSNSYTVLHSLIEKFNNYPNYDDFYVDLLFSYHLIYNIFYFCDEYPTQIDTMMEQIDDLSITAPLKEHSINMYVFSLLDRKQYTLAFKYINNINPVRGPNVSPETMSFLNTGSTGKTLLIYEGGGLGDYFMFGRFIPKLCNSYKENKIVFFVTSERVVWIFRELFKDIQNLSIISLSESSTIPHIDHHCSLIYLMKVFQINYENLTFEPMMTQFTGTNINHQIHRKNKQTYILNWKGNEANLHEIHNRRMNLEFAIPLFQLKHIHWVVITKNITNQEKCILKRNNVLFLGDKLDNGEKCFEDSIAVIKDVTGVISTDTSIVHLAANLNIPTTVLLTFGCEWRWTNDKTTNWYPDMTLVRQEKQGDWKSVIEKVISII
jgi:hypothetical protein